MAPSRIGAACEDSAFVKESESKASGAKMTAGSHVAFSISISFYGVPFFAGCAISVTGATKSGRQPTMTRWSRC